MRPPPPSLLSTTKMFPPLPSVPWGQNQFWCPLCSGAPDETACAFITRYLTSPPMLGLNYIPVCLASQVSHIWVSFSEIVSPPDSSGQRRPRATPVWRWFHKAAFDRGNGELRDLKS